MFAFSQMFAFLLPMTCKTRINCPWLFSVVLCKMKVICFASFIVMSIDSLRHSLFSWEEKMQCLPQMGLSMTQVVLSECSPPSFYVVVCLLFLLSETGRRENYWMVKEYSPKKLYPLYFLQKWRQSCGINIADGGLGFVCLFVFHVVSYSFCLIFSLR